MSCTGLCVYVVYILSSVETEDTYALTGIAMMKMLAGLNDECVDPLLILFAAKKEICFFKTGGFSPTSHNQQQVLTRKLRCLPHHSYPAKFPNMTIHGMLYTPLLPKTSRRLGRATCVRLKRNEGLLTSAPSRPRQCHAVFKRSATWSSTRTLSWELNNWSFQSRST